MIGLISLGVWAHHMFTVGMTSVGNTFFMISTLLVAVPTGIKIFNWLGTLYGGKIRFELPMLFCLAFLFQFLIAGLTGVMLAVALDWQLSDSYFVVAHFHYSSHRRTALRHLCRLLLLVPKSIWTPAQQKLGSGDWLFAIGFHSPSTRCTFRLSHAPAHLHLRRRAAGRCQLDYSLGALVQGVGLLCLVVNLLWSRKKVKWRVMIPDAWTSSGPQPRRLPNITSREAPIVRSRRPLWDEKHPEDPD